jgi:hypothetical protein
MVYILIIYSFEIFSANEINNTCYRHIYIYLVSNNTYLANAYYITTVICRFVQKEANKMN